jgi:hypothetical protein
MTVKRSRLVSISTVRQINVNLRWLKSYSYFEAYVDAPKIDPHSTSQKKILVGAALDRMESINVVLQSCTAHLKLR